MNESNLSNKEQGDAVSDTTAANSKADADQQTSSKEPAPTEDWEKEFRDFCGYFYRNTRRSVSVDDVVQWIKSHVPKQIEQ